MTTIFTSHSRGIYKNSSFRHFNYTFSKSCCWRQKIKWSRGQKYTSTAILQARVKGDEEPEKRSLAPWRRMQIHRRREKRTTQRPAKGKMISEIHGGKNEHQHLMLTFSMQIPNKSSRRSSSTPTRSNNYTNDRRIHGGAIEERSYRVIFWEWKSLVKLPTIQLLN